MCLLRTELRTFGGADSALNHRANAPALKDCNASSELRLHALIPRTRTILPSLCLVLLYLCPGTKCYVQTFSGEMQHAHIHAHTYSPQKRISRQTKITIILMSNLVFQCIFFVDVGVTKRNTGERLLNRSCNNSKALASPNRPPQHG